MGTKITCPYCKGTGKDFYELLAPISFCIVCNGSGTIELEKPYKECVFCSGTGKNPLGARVTCIVCGGKGYNSHTGEIICENAQVQAGPPMACPAPAAKEPDIMKGIYYES